MPLVSVLRIDYTRGAWWGNWEALRRGDMMGLEEGAHMLPQQVVSFIPHAFPRAVPSSYNAIPTISIWKISPMLPQTAGCQVYTVYPHAQT